MAREVDGTNAERAESDGDEEQGGGRLSGWLTAELRASERPPSPSRPPASPSAPPPSPSRPPASPSAPPPSPSRPPAASPPTPSLATPDPPRIETPALDASPPTDAVQPPDDVQTAPPDAVVAPPSAEDVVETAVPGGDEPVEPPEEEDFAAGAPGSVPPDAGLTEELDEEAIEPAAYLPARGGWRGRAAAIVGVVVVILLLFIFLRHRSMPEPGVKTNVPVAELPNATNTALLPGDLPEIPPDEELVDENDVASAANGPKPASPAGSGETPIDDPRLRGSSVGRFPDLPLPTLILLEKAAEQPKAPRAPKSDESPADGEK